VPGSPAGLLHPGIDADEYLARLPRCHGTILQRSGRTQTNHNRISTFVATGTTSRVHAVRPCAQPVTTGHDFRLSRRHRLLVGRELTYK
jgi:hypothetical protein